MQKLFVETEGFREEFQGVRYVWNVYNGIAKFHNLFSVIVRDRHPPDELEVLVIFRVLRAGYRVFFSSCMLSRN